MGLSIVILFHILSLNAITRFAIVILLIENSIVSVVIIFASIKSIRVYISHIM